MLEAYPEKSSRHSQGWGQGYGLLGNGTHPRKQSVTNVRIGTALLAGKGMGIGVRVRVLDLARARTG